MRKLSFLVLFAAICMLSTTTFAQETKVVVEKIEQDKVEIKLSELPETVTKTLNEEFADFTSEKAYKATIYNKDIFYIKLVNKNGIYTGATINANGTVVGLKSEKLVINQPY